MMMMSTMMTTLKTTLDHRGVLHFVITLVLRLSHLERFSIECSKTKTKVITDQSQRTKAAQVTNQNSKQMHVTGAKRGKTRTTKSRLVLVWHLIG